MAQEVNTQKIISLRLEILSPEGETFNDTVDEIILPTLQGQIAILPNHAPLFTKLTEGEIVIKKAGKAEFVAITGGFLEINENNVHILADYAIRSDKIETKRAEEAKKKAEEILNEKERVSEVDFALAEKDLKKSILELKISENVRKRHRE